MSTPAESWMKSVEDRLARMEAQLLRLRPISPPSTMPGCSSDSSGSPADAPATSPSNPPGSAESAAGGPGAPGPGASTPASPGGGGSSSSSPPSLPLVSHSIYEQAKNAADKFEMGSFDRVQYRPELMRWVVPDQSVAEIREYVKSACSEAHRSWYCCVLPLLPEDFHWDGTPKGAIEALVAEVRKTSGIPDTQAAERAEYKKLRSEIDWLRGIVRQIAVMAEQGRGLVP